MDKIEISARNSKALVAQVDRLNAKTGLNVSVNWGREGDRGTWYAHAAYGSRLRTGLQFHDVVQYVQDEFDTAVECKDS